MTPAAGALSISALVHEAVESVAATHPPAIDALQDEEQLLPRRLCREPVRRTADRPDYLRLSKGSRAARFSRDTE